MKSAYFDQSCCHRDCASAFAGVVSEVGVGPTTIHIGDLYQLARPAASYGGKRRGVIQPENSTKNLMTYTSPIKESRATPPGRAPSTSQLQHAVECRLPAYLVYSYTHHDKRQENRLPLHHRGTQPSILPSAIRYVGMEELTCVTEGKVCILRKKVHL